MANKLLESYKNRIALVENLFARKNPGQKLSGDMKMVIAQTLDNEKRFLTESVRGTAGIGVQLADMGAIKQAAIDVTNLVHANMIAQNLVLVKPMTNFNTILFWRQYALGTRKGGAGGIGEVAPFAGAMSSYDPHRQELQPWNANNIINGWGTADFMKMSPERQAYTSENVVETVAVDTADFVASFGPVVVDGFDAEAHKAGMDATKHYIAQVVEAAGTVRYIETPADFDNSPVTPSMTAFRRDGGAQPADMEAKLTARKISGANLKAGDRIAYKYDNAYIPAEQIPSVVMRMQRRPVQAKIRRINYMFSKLAAWEAKNELGFDLQAEMVQEAAHEIEYETDCEIIDMLLAMGDANVYAHALDNGYQFGGYGDIVWVDEELDTISYSMKAEGFLRKLAQAKAAIYEQTGRFMPSWMLASPQMMTILSFCPGFKPASMSQVNGAYKAGTLDGMDIYVTPRIGGKVCYLGVLGKEFDTAAGIYMPFLPITPSQLLEFPDDSTVQGLVTVYGLEALNSQLVCRVRVVDGDGYAGINLFDGTSENRRP